MTTQSVLCLPECSLGCAISIVLFSSGWLCITAICLSRNLLRILYAVMLNVGVIQACRMIDLPKIRKTKRNIYLAELRKSATALSLLQPCCRKRLNKPDSFLNASHELCVCFSLIYPACHVHAPYYTIICCLSSCRIYFLIIS